MPLVSVNVLCYNHAPYIQQRIESVLQQTFTDYELLIWDDASTDSSRKIIEQYRGNKKVADIIYNKINSGSGYLQWQKVIEHCTAKYLWIAEGDDFAEPDFLEKTVAALENYNTASLVETDSYYVRDGNKINRVSAYKNQNFQKDHWCKDFIMPGKEAVLNILSRGNCIANASGVLFKTAALKNIDFKFSKYKYSADWALYIELFKTDDYAYLHEPLSAFRLHDENATALGRASGAASRENFDIIAGTIPFLKLNGRFDKNYIKSVNRYISIFSVPFAAKLSLLFFYLKRDANLAVKGLYYNFKNRFIKTK